MDNVLLWTAVVLAVIVISAWQLARRMPRGPQIPEALRVGKTLPDFSATDEDGNPVSSLDLRGKPAVILFVRGNWCPFCSRQVEKLTAHYKAIGDSGAKLIFVTPKPQETTQRVAEFFEVDFDFWLDESLAVANRFGLVQPDGVPADSSDEYGPDTVWPTAIIVDKDGVIRYSKLSRYIYNRPDPELLLSELEKIEAPE